ncbi:MAG TPA: hypothetical protein VK988_20135 [Acidimicrobiales bacterium]|nr:hypothetical protein [Acidimicrobiales bacterium]
MSGERSPLVVRAERATVLARAVEALDHFPADQTWVLVGGVAVFLRLGSVTRPTADADTVAQSQAALLDELNGEDVVVIAGGGIEMSVGDGVVRIDVMDLNDDPLPGDTDRRAFALARREALRSATPENILVTDRTGADIARAVVPLASIGSLVSLKTVSMIRRPHGNHPEKVGSDIHDLVRLVGEAGARTLAVEIASGDRELAAWVADQITRAFGVALRFTLVRLRRTDRSAGAQALTDADVAATIVLGDELHQCLAGGAPEASGQ